MAKADEVLQAVKMGQEATGKIDSDDGPRREGRRGKAAIALDALRKLLEPAKQSAAKSAEEAASKFTDAEKKSKEVTTTVTKATDELTAAKRTLDTAKRGLERAEKP